MVTKPLNLELVYGHAGKRLMFRSICFSMVLALMPFLAIVQDAAPCDLSAGIEPIYTEFYAGIYREVVKIWAEKQKAEFYSAIFKDLMNQGLLRPRFKCLCVGGGSADAVLALRENGVTDTVGIDWPSCKGKFRRLPFGVDSFDFVFSESFDRARAPALFAMEIERTLKPGSVAIIVASRRRMGRDSNPVLTVALFRNSDVVDITATENSSVISLRKRAVRPKPLSHCSHPKHNKSLVDLAEPLTENHSNAIYLPSVVDISYHNRHVYVEIGVNDTENNILWFSRAYPKQNKAFKIYTVGLDESAPANLNGTEVVQLQKQGNGEGLEIGGWMKKIINIGDFAVVKVGLPYLRGVMESGGMCLIDEIFVDCNANANADDCIPGLHALRNNGVFAHKW